MWNIITKTNRSLGTCLVATHELLDLHYQSSHGYHLVDGIGQGSQLISMVDHKGPKSVQRYMSEGQMNIISLCVSMYFKVDKEPTKKGRLAGFGPRAACLERLTIGGTPWWCDLLSAGLLRSCNLDSWIAIYQHWSADQLWCVAYWVWPSFVQCTINL